MLTSKLSQTINNDGFLKTQIVGKCGLWVTSLIYKHETSTTYPLYETM